MPPLSLPKGSRLFRRLDPERFRAAFQRFMTGFSKQCNAVVAIDGKLLRRSGCAHRLVLEIALAFQATPAFLGGLGQLEIMARAVLFERHPLERTVRWRTVANEVSM
jgi:hypothetical protein